MANWDVLCPVAKIIFDVNSPNYASLAADLARIAGVREAKGFWHIPFNALYVALDVAEAYGVGAVSATWAKAPPSSAPAWEEVEAALRVGGEVRPFLFEGFLMPYQKEALCFGWNLSGVHYWHPTGCLTGDTRLTINRAGKSSSITLKELVNKLNGQEGSWDKAIATRAQCSIDGHIRLNQVVNAVATGRKIVYEVETRGGLRVKGSKDHKFSTPNGFVPLEMLTVGSVVHIAGLVRSSAKRNPKTRYHLTHVRYHPYAKNNHPDNLVVMSQREHAISHGREGGWKRVIAPQVEDIVERITELGEEETFDLTMLSPNNNYVANGFVVHNSGKTCTGILCALSQPGTLVIVTRAASRIQYGREVERFTNLKAHVVRPESQLRKKDQPLDAYLQECMTEGRRAVVVLGWESVKNNLDMLKKLRAGPVIYDESHRGKSAKRWDTLPLAPLPDNPDEALAQLRKDKADADAKKGFIKDTDTGRTLFIPHVSTASAAAELARLVHKRICTTATPIKDRVRDLYAQLDLAEPNGWGNTTAWMDRYADRKPGAYGGFDTPGASNTDELNSRLTTIAHILDYRETHRALPAKRRQSIYIPPEDQVKPDASFNKAMKEAANRGPGALLEVKLQRSAQMKRKAVLDLIEDHVGSRQKVVVFTGRKADCEDLGDAVKKMAIVKKLGAQVWAAHGEQPTAVRQRIVDAYMQSDGPCVLVATGQSFGESLNLQDTDAALFVMLPYDPGQLRQWEGRFSRLGQKRPVVIYYVIAEGTVDEHVAQLLIEKLPAVEKIAKDSELAEAGSVLAGYDGMDPDKFAESVLSSLDLD